MELTIQQYYELLKEKRDNAQNDVSRHYIEGNQRDFDKNTGARDAYTDAIVTLEASHLLDKKETINQDKKDGLAKTIAKQLVELTMYGIKISLIDVSKLSEEEAYKHLCGTLKCLGKIEVLESLLKELEMEGKC